MGLPDAAPGMDHPGVLLLDQTLDQPRPRREPHPEERIDIDCERQVGVVEVDLVEDLADALLVLFDRVRLLVERPDVSLRNVEALPAAPEIPQPLDVALDVTEIGQLKIETGEKRHPADSVRTCPA